MRDDWTYHRAKKFDKHRVRWHFVTRYFHVTEGQDAPRELYFRNDDATEFGMLRFEKLQDNPYRDWDAIVTKILNNVPFRRSLLDEDTASVWKKNWK
jgi:hypothetical protein